MNARRIHLEEQAYMGVSTQIFFSGHDAVDFRQLQLDVITADIPNRISGPRFLALDSDFQTDSFRYTPLVPVAAFEGDQFTRYTLQKGDYYCFDVAPEALNPQWFQACFAYMEQQNFRVDRSFDLEYYAAGYAERLRTSGVSLEEPTLCILFRKLED